MSVPQSSAPAEPSAEEADSTPSASAFPSFDALAARLGAPASVGPIRGRGKGCEATRNIEPGELLWCEPALLFQRSSGSCINVACDECCCWIGDVAAGLQRVIDWAELADGSDLAGPSGAIGCFESCGSIYCSTQCRDYAWQRHHRLLCTGCGAAGDPGKLSKGQQLHRGALLAYEQHAERSGCAEPLALLAKAVAGVLTEWEARNREEAVLASCMAAFGMPNLHCVPWWDTGRSGSNPKPQQLKGVLEESLRLLHLALLPCHRNAAKPLFDVDWCAQLLGGLERNLLSVEIECPALRFSAGDGTLDRTEMELLRKAAAAVAAKSSDSCREKSAESNPSVDASNDEQPLDDRADRADVQCVTAASRAAATSAGWPTAEGAALFEFTATLNHSCRPNCLVSYDSSAVAKVTTQRAIAKNEELLICYIDENQNLETRQDLLVTGYGFECQCERCSQEKNRTS
eukprot:SAG31_NODE_1815_length_7210_cov_7.167628_10_plen_460_part_00